MRQMISDSSYVPDLLSWLNLQSHSRRNLVYSNARTAVLDASSGHLRRCSDADTVNMSLSRENDASIPS
eukprot:scaffold1663_cov182-Skeletonema_marinoi.AAC.10